MRKTLLIIFAIYGTLISQAQIPKNATLIGGQFSFSAQKKSNYGENWYRTNNSQNFSISAGKAFKENKVVGLSIGYSHNKQSYSDTIYQRFASYNAGIFYRQYAKLANRFYLFGQADLYCSFSKERTENYFNWDNDETKSIGVVTSLTPGISYQLLKKLQVELTIPNLISIGYTAGKATNTDWPDYYTKTRSFSVNTAFTNAANLGIIGIGFRFVL